MNLKSGFLIGALAAVVSMTGLTACGEKPQRVMHEGGTAHTSERWDGQLRDRTLKQGESGRMSY